MKLNIERKHIIIAGTALCMVLIGIIIAVVCTHQKGTDNITDIQVSEEEIQKYKEMIGNGMDIKKSVLILFDTYDECQSFIDEFGAEDNPQSQGKGTVAYMPNGYYNIVGKSILEECFDSLSDGEYTKEPIEYSGMFCYLKRIGIETPIDDEEELRNIIQNDKSQNQ